MEWSKKYATGFTSIDEQHKMLFRMTNDYRIALEENKGERVFGIFLQSLSQYAKSHFGVEEKCMFEHRCPSAAKNKNAHKEFSQTLDKYRAKYEAMGYHPQHAKELMDEIEDWLVTHICQIDKQLHKCARKAL